MIRTSIILAQSVLVCTTDNQQIPENLLSSFSAEHLTEQFPPLCSASNLVFFFSHFIAEALSAVFQVLCGTRRSYHNADIHPVIVLFFPARFDVILRLKCEVSWRSNFYLLKRYIKEHILEELCGAPKS